MRKIDTHKVNGLNDAIQICVMDEPGAGGACHKYELHLTSRPGEGNPITGGVSKWSIDFQNGPIKEAGFNGLSGESLLAIVRDRLECFQAGPYACPENQEALDHVVAAMETLHRRTKERMARQVEGTHQK